MLSVIVTLLHPYKPHMRDYTFISPDIRVNGTFTELHYLSCLNKKNIQHNIMILPFALSAVRRAVSRVRLTLMSTSSGRASSRS